MFTEDISKVRDQDMEIKNSEYEREIIAAEDLSGFEFSEVVFKGCRFIQCDLTKACFYGCKFDKCDLSNCKIADGYFKECEF